VLLRRARTPCGEIDIVAESPDAAMIAFIEVKARASFREAAWALSAVQRERLLGAAGILLERHPHWAGRNLRFDLFLLDGEGRVRRIADAFRIGDG
jgi:putative endonuclease